MPRRRTLLGTVGAAAALALFTSGCSTDSNPESPEGLTVVATTTQVADITRQVVGDTADVTQMLDAGASAHGFDPTPAALQALASTDVRVRNGAGLEEWLAPVIEASGFSGEVIDASEGVQLIESGDHNHDHDDHGEHHDHDHADDHDHDEHHDHDHGTHDPHVWTDPASVISMTQTISAALGALEPDAAEAFIANAEAYVTQLELLDTWMREAFESVPVEERLLVTNHDTFQYLARAYNIAVVGSVLPSFDDNAEPSAAAIDALVAEIRATGAVAVFSEAQLSPALAETIAEEAGVTVYSGEDALFTDSLGAEGSLGDTYIGSQIHNTQIMVQAWGAQPPAPPEEIV